MKWERRRLQFSRFIVLLLIFMMIGALPMALSDPIDNDQADGTRELTWNFSTEADYIADNIAISQNDASLSTYESTWTQTSIPDFNNATETNNIDISAGEVRLFLDTDIETLKNGDFSEPPIDPVADYWSNESIFEGIGSFSYNRDSTNYFWNLTFFDPLNTAPANGTVWLNQTVFLPTVPLNINTSIIHRFVLGDEIYEINRGTNASVVLTTPYNKNITILERDWVNETDTSWVSLSNEDISYFNSTGNYTYSIITYVESNVTNRQVGGVSDGVYNYWDNASLRYDAYRTAGNLTSQVFDTGSYSMWNNLSWNEGLPAGTDIEIFVRTGNSSVPTDSIWSDWSGPYTNPSGNQIGCPWGRYVQYRAELSTLTTNVTPVLENISISYDKFYPTGTLQTEDYSPANITSWGLFSHDEELNGQGIVYQYSTDSGTNWIEIPLDGDLRFLDSWASIRIRGVLSTTDSVITPTINWMKLSYVSTEPAFTLEPIWSEAGAEAGETIRLYVHFNNTADGDSANVWLNVYLDEEMEYLGNNTATLSSFDSYIQDDNPNVKKYLFAEVPNSQNMFWIDARINSGISDGAILQTTVTMEYEDPLGNRVASMLELADIRVNSPEVSAEFFAVEDSGDVGDSIHYQVKVNNTGQGLAEHVWLNTTLDDRLLPVGQSNQNIALHIGNLAGQSSKMQYFNATLNDNVVQNSLVPAILEIEYSDSAGFMRQSNSNQVTILARLKSSITISLVSSTSSVNSSDVFTVIVHYNNTGYGSAETISFNMTIPDGLDFDTSSEEFILLGEHCIWELEDVGPGPHSFTVTFRAQKMDQEFYNTEMQIFMHVTDPVDGNLPDASSNMVSIEVQRIYTFWEKIYWPWSGIAMAIAGFCIAYGLWYYFKPEPPTIDDVFVTYRDGRLISHRKSKSGMQAGLDGDLVSAMLTAVQEFISDSLSKDRTDKVKKLEFGDKELYVERGENVHMAVIYSGSMNKKLEEEIQVLTRNIEDEHPFLKAWDGRMSKLDDIDSQLDEFIEKWQYLNGSEEVPEIIAPE